MQLSSGTDSNTPTVLLIASLAVMSLGAAAIHFVVIGEHFDEYVWFGLFFAVVAWLPGLWAIAVVASPSRPLLTGALVGNLVVVAVLVGTRTFGVPFGPEAGEAEPASLIDVVATALEVLILVGCVALLRARGVGRDRHPGRHAVVAAVVLALVAIPVTTAVIVPFDAGEAPGQTEPTTEHGG